MLSGLSGRSTRPRQATGGRCRPLQGRRALIVAILAPSIFAIAGPIYSAPSETLVPLLQQAIPNLPGKTLTAINVVFPPGAVSAPHRHGGAFLYAYVLEGVVRSQIEGQAAQIYRTGESWTEKPGDHHVLTQNASSTETARLLVVFVADTGATLKIDDPRKEP